MTGPNSSDDPEYDPGYSDAPNWYWRIVGGFLGWRGDVSLWAICFGLGFIVAMAFALLGLWWATS